MRVSFLTSCSPNINQPRLPFPAISLFSLFRSSLSWRFRRLHHEQGLLHLNGFEEGPACTTAHSSRVSPSPAPSSGQHWHQSALVHYKARYRSSAQCRSFLLLFRKLLHPSSAMSQSCFAFACLVPGTWAVSPLLPQWMSYHALNYL